MYVQYMCMNLTNWTTREHRYKGILLDKDILDFEIRILKRVNWEMAVSLSNFISKTIKSNSNSLPIPPKTQENHPGRQSGHGHRLARFPEFWSRPFALDVVITDPFVIASHNPLQKRVNFAAIAIYRWKFGPSSCFGLPRVAPKNRASF